TALRVAQTSEEKQEKQSYTTRCAGPSRASCQRQKLNPSHNMNCALRHSKLRVVHATEQEEIVAV
ncbi:hypothetical protein A2U01_0057616, partial [Trifolium medium]|nr:hypothetical protein [Trifolium medium]